MSEETKAVIKQHGIKWINKDREVACPECTASGKDIRNQVKMETDLSTATDPKIGHATKKYTAQCLCVLCNCGFEIYRSE